MSPPAVVLNLEEGVSNRALLFETKPDLVGTYWTNTKRHFRNCTHAKCFCLAWYPREVAKAEGGVYLLRQADATNDAKHSRVSPFSFELLYRRVERDEFGWHWAANGPGPLETLVHTAWVRIQHGRWRGEPIKTIVGITDDGRFHVRTRGRNSKLEASFMTGHRQVIESEGVVCFAETGEPIE